MDIQPASSRSRLEFLDSARGLAASYVVLYHLALIPEPDLLVPRWAYLLVHNGGMGVALFFVVSAFSLCYTLPMRFRERAPWAGFVIHRFFRIAPLFYLWIVITLVRDRLVFDASHGPLEILLSATFLFNLVPGQQEGFVWASWTIGIEMLFYLLFPLVYYQSRSLGRAVATTLLVFVGWWLFRGATVYWSMDEASKTAFLRWTLLRHLPIFACGIVAYRVFMRWEESGQVDDGRGRMLLMTGLAMLLALVNGWLPNIFGDGYYWQGVAFIFVLLGMALDPVSALVNRATRYLGKLSYSIYLNHPTIILLLGPVYAAIYRHLPNLSAAFSACVLLTIACVLAASELTFRLVEEPGIQLGKRVNRIVQSRFRPTQSQDVRDVG